MVFTTLRGVRFHRSAQDRLPVMALNLGAREASIPLKSLRREFNIGDQSHDGMMLDLVELALDYVSSIRLGDRFPPELLTGDASWRPSPDHLRLASTRLALDLVCWLSPSSRWAQTQRDVRTLLRLAQEAELQTEVEALAGRCAEELGMNGREHLLQTLDELSRELSFIEALRDSLMARVERFIAFVAWLRPARLLAGLQAEMLVQIGRLGAMAERQLRSRFAEVDAQTQPIAGLLSNVESQRTFIRSHRDWLYCSERAWQPLLDQWDRVRDDLVRDGGSAGIAALLASTYQFLAPRFMPTMEWMQNRRQCSPHWTSLRSLHRRAAFPLSRLRQRVGVREAVGWGGRDRTSEWRNQNPLPYRLATPQPAACVNRAAAGGS